MKNRLKFIGIITFAAVMGFCFASCGENISFADPGATNPGTNPDNTVAVTGVSLNKSSISLIVDDSETLTATITPSNATNKNVTWSSSNTTVAKVSTSGIVTAVAAGTATITVTTVDGSKKANCSVTVSGGANPGSNNYDIFVLDISQKTDWDYMVVGEDGSSIFFSVNKSNDIPTRLFLKPNKNSDDGFTILFKENGLPEKVIAKNHILYFGNFRDYKFDLAIIYPNNTIKYFYDIETDINWNANSQGRTITFSKLKKSLNFVSDALGIGTCIVSVYFQPAFGACASYVASTVAKIVVNQVFDGFTADLGNAFIDVFGCAGNIGNVLDAISVADSCVSALANTANLLTYMDINLTNQKAQEIAQANGQINGGRGDVKVTLTWNNLSDVDLHVIDPYEERIYWNHKNSQSGGILDFDNRNGYGPENIYWPAGKAPDGTYEVYVHFYDYSTSGVRNDSSEFIVVINAFGNTKTYTGVVAKDGGYVYVATFNNDGNIYISPQMSRSGMPQDLNLSRLESKPAMPSYDR